MEAAFWTWTHGTPAAHIYGIYTAHQSVRIGLHYSRELLHTIQETMYFDDTAFEPAPLRPHPTH